MTRATLHALVKDFVPKLLLRLVGMGFLWKKTRLSFLRQSTLVPLRALSVLTINEGPR